MRIAKTPAPKKDRIYGSKINKPKSASSRTKAKSIKLSQSVIASINSIIEGTDISLATAKAVVRRGMGAYSSSHRPTITGGKPNSRVAWGLARLKAFVYKAEKGKSKSGRYTQDDDLLKESGYKVKEYADGGEITSVNKNNYFQSTKCDFKPVNFKDCIEILDQYKSWRRKKNKPEFIVSAKYGNLSVDYESERKSAFWQSRSLSYYFVSENNEFIIRISDHWSKSNYDRSKKLNCGFIRSCYWTNFGEKFTYDIPSQSYSSELIGGVANFSDFSIIGKDGLFKDGGNVLLAPNGKPSNLTHEQWHLVRTPEFKAWFGDWENDPANASKVLDSNGEPLVVYHGTNNKFNEFEPSKPNFYAITEGTYFFTNKKSVAENFGDIVLSVFLQIDNPTYLDGRNSGRFNTWTLYDDADNYGFIVENSDTGGGIATEYAVENSNQIKLADGTNTTFDANNPDIRFDEGGLINEESSQTFYERTYADGTKKRFSVDEYENKIYPQIRFEHRGRVDISEWETEEPELFKCLLTVRSLVEANATVKDSFVDTHNNLYVIEYEDSNPYFDGIITETCKTLTECEDYLEVEEVEVTDKFVLVPLANNTDIGYEEGGLVDDILTVNTYKVTTGSDTYSDEQYSGEDYDEAISIYAGITSDYFANPNGIANYKQLTKYYTKYKFVGELDEDHEISDYTDDLDNKDYWEIIEEDYEDLLNDSVQAINKVTDDFIYEIQEFINNKYVNGLFPSNYMDIKVYEDEGKENYLDKITVRVKDHSQNPLNKKGKYNLSFVIADVNATKNRFRTIDEYYFDSSDDFEKIKNEIESIIEEKTDEVRDDYDVDRFAKGGKVNDELYSKWEKLVNMSASELKQFMATKDGKEAGLTKGEADELGIKSGHESAKWILKMKATNVNKWTPKMWEWAKRQVSFISRMRGNKGGLYDKDGNKTRKHTSLLIWGHNPMKFNGGGMINEDSSIYEIATDIERDHQDTFNKIKLAEKYLASGNLKLAKKILLGDNKEQLLNHFEEEKKYLFPKIKNRSNAHAINTLLIQHEEFKKLFEIADSQTTNVIIAQLIVLLKYHMTLEYELIQDFI